MPTLGNNSMAHTMPSGMDIISFTTKSYIPSYSLMASGISTKDCGIERNDNSKEDSPPDLLHPSSVSILTSIDSKENSSLNALFDLYRTN